MTARPIHSFLPACGGARSVIVWRIVEGSWPAHRVAGRTPRGPPRFPGTVAGAAALTLHLDRPPTPLGEPPDAQPAPRHVSRQDREPDVDRLEGPEGADRGADPHRHRHLREEGDEERALGVAGALEGTGVSERHGDEEPREGQDPEELHAQLDVDGAG